MILFASDSRGKFLHQTHGGNSFRDYHVIISPGATIAKLNDLILDYVQNEPVEKVVVQCGLCNLSSKISYKHGYLFQYFSDADNLLSIEQQLEDLAELLTPIKLQIITIPPMSLTKATKHYSIDHTLSSSLYEKLQMQEILLEKDINILNSFIFDFNTMRDQPTIRWDRDLFKTVVKKRGRTMKNVKKNSKYIYTHLYDGIHPDEHMSIRWMKSLSSLLKSPVCTLDLSDDSSSDEESWDFKRLKVDSHLE
jgi:hypothetical protein